MDEAIAVTLYTETQVWIGFIHQPDGNRLSDLLNGMVLGQPVNNGMLLELSDVSISSADVRKERLETANIHKATIQLVATSHSDSARGLGVKAGPKSLPYVKKSPVCVKIRTLTYELSGNVHCSHRQSVMQLFKEERTFLPVTDAKMRQRTDGLWRGTPFVAVNKEQISSFQHEEIHLHS